MQRQQQQQQQQQRQRQQQGDTTWPSMVESMSIFSRPPLSKRPTPSSKRTLSGGYDDDYEGKYY